MNKTVIDFTKKELERLQTLAGDIRDIQLAYPEHQTKDDFRMSISEGEGVLYANSARGMLFAVYAYANQYLGFDFSKLGEEIITTAKKISDSQSFKFSRRGNIFEVINDVPYLKKQIDSNAKHYHNEMFFTFQLFNEVSDSILDDLNKRDMKVTLGGHSLKWLLEPIMTLEKSEDQNLNFYNDVEMMDYVVNRIVAICKEYDCVSRISLWPQDIGIPKSKGPEFMQAYIDFTFRIKKALQKNQLDVAVEYIVYNAGLNWEMLTYYEELELYDDLDILYAYWGRDYSQNLAPKRAVNLLKQWLDKGNVTVLEYYSDFFMMSELYPPLHNRIISDVEEYEELKVTGLLNLVVPLLPSRTADAYREQYDYQQYHQKNNITYSKSMCKYHDIKLDLFDTKLEQLMSPITRYNAEIFPKRLVDIKPEAKEKEILLNVKNILGQKSSEYTQMLLKVIDVMLGDWHE